VLPGRHTHRYQLHIFRRNYQEIPAVMELAASLGHIKVNFIGLSHAITTERNYSPPRYEEAIRLTCEAAQKYGVSFFFDEPFFWSAVRDGSSRLRLRAAEPES
jgi:MoaA/NifB/PqqE/SkfB family radical SAM enzyme